MSQIAWASYARNHVHRDMPKDSWDQAIVPDSHRSEQTAENHGAQKPPRPW